MSSGYSSEAAFTSFIKDHGFHFIQKPFRLNTLLEKVKELLDSPGQTGQNDEKSLPKKATPEPVTSGS